MDASSLTLFSLGVTLLIRNSLVYRHHKRRGDEVHARNLRAIDEGWWTIEMLNDYEKEVGNYFVDLLNLRIWTYSQFYPNELPTRATGGKQ